MKKILCFLLLFVFLFPCFVFSASDRQTLGELRSEYQSKLNDLQEYERKTDEAKKEIREKEAQIKQAEADIHAAEEEEQKVQSEIEESNKKIEEMNAEIERLTKEVEKVLLYLQQMRGQNAYVEYVSGSSTMTDFITRLAAVEQVSNHIQKTMDELEGKVKALEEEVKKNEELKKELIQKQENLKVQSENYKKVIQARYSDIASYDKYALDIGTQVKSLKMKLDAAEKNCSNYAPEKGADAIISEDCIPKSGGVIENAGWLKPLERGTVTSEVGRRWGSYHNALDIGGPSPFEGTPIYAAAAGVVSGKINQYSCGGNMLYIDVTVNGQPYTTYYYHLLKFNVNVGDVVTQNTIIGWVGGYSTSRSHGGYDSCTTGAHLHFGVARGYYNGYSVPMSNVITPPGFPNRYGWSFYSRYDMYG